MSTSHVLVVDDEADIRALIDEILSDEGYEVTVAGDAGEARRAVRPDLGAAALAGDHQLRAAVRSDPRLFSGHVDHHSGAVVSD